MNKKRTKNKSKGGKELRTLLDNSVDPAVIVDKYGTFLEVSKKAEEIIGFKRKEIVGKKFLDVDIVTEESKRVLKENLVRRMREEEVKRYEIEVLTRDGAKRPYEVTGLLIEYKGEPVDLVIFRDITKRKIKVSEDVTITL